MNKICIAGCGNVGSILSIFILLKNAVTHKFDEIILVDPDIVTHNSGIYIDELYIANNHPKVIALEHMLGILNDPEVKITSVINTFDNFLNSYNKTEISNTLFVDCMDNTTQNDIFSIKLACDGRYAKSIQYPKNKVGINTSYKILSDKFYSMMLCSLIINDIFILTNNSHHKKERMFVYDLDKISRDKKI